MAERHASPVPSARLSGRCNTAGMAGPAGGDNHGTMLQCPRPHAAAVLLALLAALPVRDALAQGRFTQAGLEDDCQRRLRALAPPEVKVRSTAFSALGTQPSYYVVTQQFSAPLRNGQRRASCTYRRNGEWAHDDAHAYELARELERRRSLSNAP